ncbi:kuzbanian [Carabus blaptoides fortunei]
MPPFGDPELSTGLTLNALKSKPELDSGLLLKGIMLLCVRAKVRAAAVTSVNSSPNRQRLFVKGSPIVVDLPHVRSSECPASKSMPNKTCNNGTQMCINGECFGSICLAWNLTECFLTNLTPDIDKRKLCEIACQNGTDSSTCRSTREFAARRYKS